MSDLANTFDAMARDALLQSTVIFLVGMLIARFAVRRPARVHTVLALAFLAVIVAPLASEAVRRGGWGVLPPEPTIVAKQASVIRPVASAPPQDVPQPDPLPSITLPGATEASPTAVDHRGPTNTSDALSSPASNAPTVPATIIPVQAAKSEPPAAATTSGTAVAIAALAWLLVSAWLLARLLGGVIAGRRILRSAAPCNEPAVHAALVAASERLEMNPLRVEVLQSAAVRCPMIWCWGARPQLLLPIDAARDWSSATWTSVVCHELAHWKRRDHWAALVAELVCCLMPWQVLGWWAKRRLENASEQACDDWTVAVGHSAVDYAETLLGLVAQADPPLALAALRRRSGLAGRIQHILSQTMPHPRLGRLWAGAVLLLAVISIGIAAVCQRGVARADVPPSAAPAEAANKSNKAEEPKSSDKSKSDDKAQKPAEISPAKPAAAMPGKSTVPPGGTPLLAPVEAADVSDKPETFRVVGKVMTTDDKPIADAEVYWDFVERPQSNWGERAGPRSLAHVRTGLDGGFAMEVQFPRNRLGYQTLVIRASGYGLTGFQRVDLSKPSNVLDIRLEPSVPIEGLIFTPDGVPVAGARVAVSAVTQGSDAKEEFNGWYVSLVPTESQSDRSRAYWPTPVMTDAQGKFRIDDATPRRATAELLIDAPDFPRTAVAVRHPDSLLLNPQTTYRDSPFMLVLEPPYVVNGRFVDEKTGAGIANARIEVQPYSNQSGRSGTNNIEATSDADGRYTMRVGSADTYFIKIIPPMGYPSLQNSISSREISQLAGGDRKLDYEFKLRPGVVLKGRVIESDSGDGVARAQVYYRPEMGRKLGVNDDFFPVTTADDGTFEATAVNGKGFFLVDVPNRGFYRLTVRDPRVEPYRDSLYPHGMLEIDVPVEGQKELFVIPLKRGPVLALRVLAPDGTPVEQFRAACAESSYERFFTGEDIRGSMFRLNAAQPGRKYRVFINCEKAKAGGVFEVEAPADGKAIDVTLQPWATIRGRYVYDGGAPAPEITNFTRFLLYPERVPQGDALFMLPYYGNFSGHRDTKAVTDADGNFELDGIIPGAFIYLGLSNEFAGGKRNYEIGVLNAGEVKDVGELVIHANR